MIYIWNIATFHGFVGLQEDPGSAPGIGPKSDAASPAWLTTSRRGAASGFQGNGAASRPRLDPNNAWIDSE